MSETGETIPIASDHAGIEMKDRLVSELKAEVQPSRSLTGTAGELGRLADHGARWP